MNAKGWGLLLLLALLWGSSFFFYKILVAALPPLTVVLGRLGIAAIAMNLWLAATGQSVPLAKGRWLRFLLLGFLNNALPFTLVVWSEIHISSGMASILSATMPIFMVAVAHWGTDDEKLSWAKSAGIGLGILGVMILVGPDAYAGGSSVWGELAVVVAACVYAFAAIYSRQFKDLPPLVAATGQVSGGAVIMVPLSLLLDHPWSLPMPDAGVWASLLAIALINTALAYFVYYRMLAGTGVTHISLVTLLNPVIALLLGAVFLGEGVTTRALAGMVVIGAGLATIDGGLFKRRSILHQSR